MNNLNSRGTPRPILTPQYHAIHTQATSQRGTVATMIPPIELRRLVAAMVD